MQDWRNSRRREEDRKREQGVMGLKYLGVGVRRGQPQGLSCLQIQCVHRPTHITHD